MLMHWLDRAQASWRRWLLWFCLFALVALMLGTLVWLARGHEIDQMQRALERDSADAAQTLHQALARNMQDLHGLAAATHPGQPNWDEAAQALLHTHREWLRIELRGPSLHALAAADSPYYPALTDEDGSAFEAATADVRQTCARAGQQGSAAYSRSRYVPRAGGVGEEVMTVCLPIGQSLRPDTRQGARNTGYVLAIYSLGGMLAHLLAPAHAQRQSVAFTELDGTRLAVHGAARPGARVFTAQQIIDLPGNTLMLRMEGARALPDVFPNVLTALVTGLSVALIAVLALLARDLRARQQAERDLAEALAFRKAMENSLITGLRARDLDGRITYVNPAFCAMVGYDAHELIGHGSPAPYWPAEQAHEYGQRQAVRLAGQAPPREGVESVFMRKDGTRFPVLIIEAPLINAQGKHTGWMSAVLDQTAQRNAEDHSRASQERLQASARLATVGEMASLMSHELNQPLAAISSYATGSLNLLPEAATQADARVLHDVRTALARIAEQAGRAGKVIRSVHDLVRQRATTRQAAQPHALAGAVLPLVQLQARKLGISVALDVPPSLPAVWCAPGMIEQVLLNLARNGMQAMEESGASGRVLTLSAHLRPASGKAARAAVVFSVADQGPGISDKVAAQLFTPFFTTKPEGMGLGLSLCRTIIEQHGSALSYASHAPQGTVFRFELPLAHSQPA